MNRTIIRNIFLTALIILALFGIYEGSFRSLTKAQKYIVALGKRRQIHSVEDFEKSFQEVLQYRARVSDDEIVKFIGGDVIDLISGGQQKEEVSRRLLSFVEKYSDEEDALHLLNIGRSFHFLWINYGQKEEDFQKAEAYYTKVLERGPRLPPALYGMLDLYRAKGDAEKVLEYGNRILALWPDDTRVITFLETIQKVHE